MRHKTSRRVFCFDFKMRPLQSGRFGALLRVASRNRLLSPLQETLKLNVGGQKYTLFREDIRKYPGSYFEKELNANSKNSETSVCRNGVLFKYINAFLVSGSLPRNASGQIDLDPKTLTLLKKEAEFYNLNLLKEECELLDAKASRSNSFAPDVGLNSDPLSVIDFNAPLVNTLCQMWRPLVTQGVVDKNALPLKLFKNNSVSKVDAVDLITAAKKISSTEFGPFRIDASFLSKPALDAVAETFQVKDMFENQLVALKARELVIRTPERKDDLVSDNIGARVGTVEVILNSAYTGGELQASNHGQVSHLSTVPYSWIAVYGDASHLWNTFVSPVTSGARVSLIYDIIPVTEVGQRLHVQHGSLEDCGMVLHDIMEGVGLHDVDMDDLIGLAQKLRPQATKMHVIHLDPSFLDVETVAMVAQKAELASLFPNQVLDIRPSDVLIHRKGARTDPITNQKATYGKGYLGTLVVVTGSYFAGGKVHLNHGQEQRQPVDSPRMSWYAYTAGTTHWVEALEYGIRVAVHYDIYSAGDVGKVHDPLETSSVTTVSRTCSNCNNCGNCNCAQVYDAVTTALTSGDAVVITLQGVYPDNVQFDALQGGDYTMYVTHAWDGKYETELVKVALQYQYNYDLRRNVLSNSSFTSSARNQTISTCNTRLVIPTKLTEQHIHSGTKYWDPLYHVTAIRVTKRK